ncbi:thiol reductant ABC exporter subunit CydC [Paenibacillus thalictri]|uniref:Thiol reductant ABC exporter subunit CydC n=1 Tax=Paenibacillus thalictri TaxID=2527873 RepID=A0A4V2J362_9BACL|nr:thiol reductant ABC exporter subunit CydC [Paenibacillus thalictri]TBL69911.1 thiol reductant ABC exporter subunit CydC [Paenibacillus thalictri]
MKELSLLSYALIRERKDIAIAIVVGFVAGAGGVSLFAGSSYLIAQTVFVPPLYTLIVLISVVKLLGLLRAFGRYAERLYSHRATFSILSRLRSSFFAKLVPLVPGKLGAMRSGDLLARIVGDIETLQHFFLRVAYPPLVLSMVFLSTVLFASFFSLWVACVLVIGLLTSAFVIPALVLLGQRRLRSRVRMQRASLATEVTEALYGYRDLKVYGLMGKREQRLQQAAAELTDGQQAAARHLLRGQSLHGLVTMLAAWCVLATGAVLVTDGSLAAVFLAMLVMATLTLFEEAAALATLPLYKQDSEHAAGRLAETFGEAEAAPSPTFEALPVQHAVAVEFRGISFRYAEQWRPALRDITLRIAAGSKTAIVGPSGAGKTTLFELILKLHTPSEGEVRLNGIPTAQLDETSIWRSAHVMLQNSHFFRGTIRDNLLLDEERRNDEELLGILHDMQLPNRSLEDPVYERGENLSAGEKQRLALARMLAKNGRFWLLDEPTASLDAVTEQRIFRNLFSRAANDTLILICHRLSGLEAMDQIVVIDQGRVVESGSFPQLMENKGYFYEMKLIEQQVIGDNG